MKVVVLPPDPAWTKKFERETLFLERALRDCVVSVHHIGSTAISGVYAKPVIDVLIEVSDLKALDGRNSTLASLGYEALGEHGIPGRRYFRKDDADGDRAYQVHAFLADSADVRRHLAFRDYLRANPAEAKRYSDLKRKLAREFADDVEGYMDGKDAFIKAIERRALAGRGGR